jgi:membrane associated rhomboid family serine protease
MLIPLRHESMQGRRWPVITIGLIALNTLIFLGTHARMDREAPELGQAKVHILILAALHPELKIQEPAAQQLVNTVRTQNPDIWKRLQSQYRQLEDGWDASIRLQEDPKALQEEMNSLSKQYSELEASSILGKYAFVPAHPTAISYLTANFLHGGWLHLIGNMWFLWLAGAILEDTWGRAIYPAFYMIAGLLALQAHAMFYPGSTTPTIGASGAIAGLMGAFLVRFPKIKIEMGWIFFFRMYRFKAAAYWLLPLWLLTEVFYGSLTGQSSGVAHWAHVGGFVFGALIAVAVRKSGLEQIAEKGIQEKVSWVSHPLLAEASEQMEKGELDAAATNLQKVLQEKPDSIDACRMLQQVYWRKQDTTSYRKTLENLIGLELKANDLDAAWQTYQDFKNSGEGKLPAGTWLDLCRKLENQPDVERVAGEYKDLAQAYPTERPGLLAQIAAGRIYLKRLDRPAEALRFYEAAKASPVPHLDWEATIDRGIADSNKILRPQRLPV